MTLPKRLAGWDAACFHKLSMRLSPESELPPQPEFVDSLPSDRPEPEAAE